MRTFKISLQGVPGASSKAYCYFGYENDKCVYQSSKLWRREADCKKAAKAWAAKG